MGVNNLSLLVIPASHLGELAVKSLIKKHAANYGIPSLQITLIGNIKKEDALNLTNFCSVCQSLTCMWAQGRS